jgi:hypothetical protein
VIRFVNFCLGTAIAFAVYGASEFAASPGQPSSVDVTAGELVPCINVLEAVLSIAGVSPAEVGAG